MSFTSAGLVDTSAIQESINVCAVCVKIMTTALCVCADLCFIYSGPKSSLETYMLEVAIFFFFFFG